MRPTRSRFARLFASAAIVAGDRRRDSRMPDDANDGHDRRARAGGHRPTRRRLAAGPSDLRRSNIAPIRPMSKRRCATAGAARNRTERTGGRRPRRIVDAKSEQQNRARRLWASARRHRPIRTGAHVLDRAHTPEQPDWRILSVQGAVLDQLGRHQDAQRHYLTALKIVPNEPSVLSNLGLSYALSKDLKDAEATLRLAVAQHSGRSAGAAKSGAGGRIGRPLRRSRTDRARRSAARPGRRQCRLSAADAGAQRQQRAHRPDRAFRAGLELARSARSQKAGTQF